MFHASFIVTFSIDRVRCHPCDQLASLDTVPSLLPVVLLSICRTRLLEIVCLLTISFFIVFDLYIKVVSCSEVVFLSPICFLTILISAFHSSVDDVGCCSKSSVISLGKVLLVWLPQARHHLMHTWLRVLGSDIEPECCQKSFNSVTFFNEKFRIIEEYKLISIELLRKRSVLVIPAKLKRSSTMV